MARDKVHGEEPLGKRNLGILEDSAYGDGEIRLALAAMKSAVSTAGAVVLPAERADDVILVPTGLKDSLAAPVLGVEVRCEFVYAIELSEVNHKSQDYCSSYIYTIILGLSFIKIQTFCYYFQLFRRFPWTTGI